MARQSPSITVHRGNSRIRVTAKRLGIKLPDHDPKPTEDTELEQTDSF
jgi:hypothetical protein